MRTWKTVIPCVALTFFASHSAAQIIGPTSSQSPHIEPTTVDWFLASLLTVGDSPETGDRYPMAGIPDGLGALGGRYDARTGRYVSQRYRDDDDDGDGHDHRHDRSRNDNR
jgi:hypothetical protein